MVNLKEMVAGFEGKLDHAVAEKGSNLSQGTRQLVCMARVLLKRPKVIFMDEATSSVDTQTDHVVQRTIKRAFAGRTIEGIGIGDTRERVEQLLQLDFIETSEFAGIVVHVYAVTPDRRLGVVYSDGGLSPTNVALGFVVNMPEL